MQHRMFATMTALVLYEVHEFSGSAPLAPTVHAPHCAQHCHVVSAEDHSQIVPCGPQPITLHF